MRTPYKQAANVLPADLSAVHVLEVLREFDRWDWTWQGFGMIRMYLDQEKRYRLNIWDERSKVPGVSLIHDHPWSFISTIYAGQIENRRYSCFEIYGDRRLDTPNTHYVKRIITGEAGHDVTSGPVPCVLRETSRETYGPGETYCQRLDEVHETRAKIGTVTINDRTEPTQEYSARVFWHKNEPTWVSAKPRMAQKFEIDRAIKSALELM